MKAKFTYHDHNYKPVDELPLPDFDCFSVGNMVENFSSANRVLYRYSREKPRPFIIVTARGCPFKCSFCRKHPEGYRPRSIQNIMAEIKQNYEKYKFNILIVQDELFAINRKRMTEFCTELIKNKKEYGWDFDWLMQTHANSKLDKETLELAKESGLYFFSYGLESASPTVLKSMHKKTDVSQIVEAVQLADELDIGFGGNLIFGDPAETEDTIRESLMFYFRYGIDPSIFLSYVTPYPGSEIFDYCIEHGIIKNKLTYYEHIDEHLFNMTQIPDDLFVEWTEFLRTLESSYLMIEATTAKEMILTEGNSISDYYNVPVRVLKADCPHCGKECSYEQMMGAGRFIVPLCQHCNKRIRVNFE